MKINKIVAPIFAILIGSQIIFAQNTNAPLPAPKATPNVSETIVKNLAQITDKTPISRERREQAYVKLFEAQRQILNFRNQRSQAALANIVKLARESLLQAIELNPNLAEGYTTLAELTGEYETAILLAGIAVKINPDNFGGHQMLARLYTRQSRLKGGILDLDIARKAIIEWNEVGRLDPRNAEAFAFLSELYSRTKMPAEQIDALKKWISSSSSSDAGFYQLIFGREANLSTENASVKLGGALLSGGKNQEAVEILSRVIADNPENGEAVALLGQAVKTADAESASAAVQALQQAVYADSENPVLIELLAQAQARSGKTDEAAKLLRDASAKLTAVNVVSAADLQITLGDIFVDAKRLEEAVAAYQNALTIRGIDNSKSITDDKRDFAIRVFDKIIEAYKKANRPKDAKAAIDRARVILNNDQLFADKRLS